MCVCARVGVRDRENTSFLKRLNTPFFILKQDMIFPILNKRSKFELPPTLYIHIHTHVHTNTLTTNTHTHISAYIIFKSSFEKL